MFLQQLITGLSVGSIYALMAVGYSLIYSLLNFTNFAHGASVLIGAYVGYFYISSVADNVLMAVVCSTFFGAVLAALIERIAYQPLLNKGVKRIYLLIAGLGISIIGENLIVVMIDGRFHAYKTSLSAMPVSILGASIGVVDLIILVASAIAKLKERRDQRAGTLSGGEQQMLAIARGLMSNPKIIMLDEPSLGLAPLIVNDIFDIIQEINREGVSVLLVEQNARKALSIADHACVLEQGRIVKQGTGSEIAADESIINAYLGAKK